MNSSQHRCMNQAPASENQMQQGSLNSSLEATVGSPLVHLVGMLLNGSTSSLPYSPLQPPVTSITCGPCNMRMQQPSGYKDGRGESQIKKDDVDTPGTYYTGEVVSPKRRFCYSNFAEISAFEAVTEKCPFSHHGQTTL
ncbi:hypothetical protein TNCV_4544801 [Trichonephila clavipes]|nr:hypothetical protein TNCV_4544801 [Trichonephila clavipes]